jgi:transposase-like protein
MPSKRQRYPAEFKAEVALEARRGELTTAQWATKHGIHHTMVSDGKRRAAEGLTAVFADRSAAQEHGAVVRGRDGKAARANRPTSPRAPSLRLA